MEKDNQLPLFWFQGQPIEVYVLNSKFLGARTNAGTTNWGSTKRVFQLLYNLNKKTNLTKFIPTELIDLLNSIDECYLESNSQNDVLLGCIQPLEYTPHLDMKLRKNHSKEVIFYDISYMGKKIQVEIKVTTFQAFIILANIFISKILDDFHRLINYDPENWSLDWYQEVSVFDDADGKSNLDGDDQKDLSNQFPWIVHRDRFSLLYLKFIQHLLETEKISPLELLRLCGAPTLVILAPHFPIIYNFVEQIILELDEIHKISFNKKLIYFTLLEMIYYNLPTKLSITKLVIQLYKNKEEVIKSLSILLDTDFPISDENIDERLQIKNH